MGDSTIGLRRLASQRVASGRLGKPAEVVRWLGAIQAQDYHQSLWAIGSRLRSGTAADVERAIAERQILRTWLMRGTIHFAAPEDVRWMLALFRPRLEAAEARRCAQLGLSGADFARSAELLSAALTGDRRLTRPELMQLLEGAGIETTGQRGYHVIWHLAQQGLICLGPMQGKQQTFVLLEDWAPRSSSRELSREESLAALAATFAASRAPVSDDDLARWAGITLADAREGLHAAGTVEARRAAGRGQAYLLAGFDEFFLGYKNRDAMIAPHHAAKLAPGANGVFRPMIVVDGQIVGTWARSVRAQALTITLHPFSAAIPDLAERVRPEAERYRDFLGLPSVGDPVLVAAP